LSSLKTKTINGLFWSFIDNAAVKILQFAIGIILARLLSPKEFGLIGMLTVFIALSRSFIDSGFGNALIRKNQCTQTDYSTVFYFNLVVGILLYIILFISSGSIAAFFNEPQLRQILQVFGLVVIIDSFTIIQKTILTKNINFKLQARISVISSIGSGIVAITLAYNGFGVWSLVIQQLLRQGLNSLFLWIWNKWLPTLVFSRESFKNLFAFGSKLLLSGLIYTTFNNLYYFVIGKFFSAQELGFYTRANQFSNLPSQQIQGVISRVSYPVLSEMQDDPVRLKAAYQRLIRSTVYITFFLMLSMAAVAEPMVIGLIGEKWRQSIIYLQLLCIVGMFYPLHALNLNMLQVKGRSDLFLKLEIIKNLLIVPVVLLGLSFGIKWMIAGMIVKSFIAYYLNSLWSGKLIGYSFFEQIKDIWPSFLFAFVISFGIYMLSLIIPFKPLLNFIVLIIIGGVSFVLLSEMLRNKDYIYIRQILFSKLLKK